MTGSDLEISPAPTQLATTAAPRIRRPAVWVAMAMGTGVFIHALLPTASLGYAMVGVGVAILACLAGKWPGARVGAFAVSLLLIGIAWAQFHRFYAPADCAIHWAQDDPIVVEAKLRIVDQPSRRPGAVRSIESLSCRAEMLAVRRDQSWESCSGSVLLRINSLRRGEEFDLRPGQTLRLIGEISRITPPENPGEYDWQKHFERERIWLRMSVRRAETIAVLEEGSSWLWQVRRVAQQSLKAGFVQQESKALASALLLGENDAILQQVWADFRASGTAHHLSISGMHIGVLAMFVLFVGRVLRLHPRRVLIGVALFAVAYGILVRPSPPVIRSVLLCLAIAASVLLKRNTDPLQCLAVAILAMILWSPLDLFNPGFQLSFGIVAALMLFARPLAMKIVNLEHEHERMARVIRPPTGIAAGWHSARISMIRALAAGAVAYMVSLPLIAIHFNQINPWTIPGSILLGPIVACSLVTGLLKMILTWIAPQLAGILAIPAEGSVIAMRWSVGLLADLPGAELSMASIPGWIVALYAALVLLPVIPGIRRLSRLRAACPAVAVIAMTVFPFASEAMRSRDGLTITFLSVGNGATTVVEMPDGGNYLIDCGASPRRDFFSNTLAPFLRERGIRNIDAVILTHMDSDHSLALQEIIDRFSPMVIAQPTTSTSLPKAGSVAWQVLSPADDRLKGNDASGVIRISFAGRSILFTGDIEERGIEMLRRSSDSLSADLLVAPHHGSVEKNTGELIAAVRPSAIVCSSSRRLTGAQEKLAGISDTPLLRTGDHGAIQVQISPQGELRICGHHGRSGIADSAAIDIPAPSGAAVKPGSTFR